jgi:hypothetical protein
MVDKNKDKFNFLPIAISPVFRTIAMDLVEVKPMSAPRGIDFYMDYVYGGGEKTKSWKDKFDEYYEENS